MTLRGTVARLLAAVRRPARRVPWLRLVQFAAVPKPTADLPPSWEAGPSSPWKPPNPAELFDEKWDDYPMLKDSSAKWMARKVYARPDFDKLTDELKARSFTAARVATDAGLQDTLRSMQRAMTEGMTVREWREKYWDRIQAKHGKPGGTAPWYTTTVFRTNQQAAFAAGRYAEMFSEEQTELQPYVRYSAIMDARVRPEHAALNGKVFLKDDPFARRYFPPVGFNCRCHLEAVPFGETPKKITNGASIPDLKKPGGGKVGPPVPGWDTDRVKSLVESFGLPTKPLPLPAPPPILLKHGDPLWAAPNGLTQEAVNEAYLWNPKVQTATLLQDGTVRLKYKSSPAKIDVAPDKAQASAALSLKKKGLPPKVVPAPAIAPAPATAPLPKLPPGPITGPAKPLPVSPGAHVPATQANLEGMYGKGGLWEKQGWDEGAVSIHLNPDGSVLKTYADGSKKLYSGAGVLADLDSAFGHPGYKVHLPDLPDAPKAPPAGILKTPLGHDITPETVAKVWGPDGVISKKGFTIDYEAELLPDGSVLLTKHPGSATPFVGGEWTKQASPRKVASIIDKQLGSPTPGKTAKGFTQADLDAIAVAKGPPTHFAGWTKAELLPDGSVHLLKPNGELYSVVQAGPHADDWITNLKFAYGLDLGPAGGPPLVHPLTLDIEDINNVKKAGVGSDLWAKAVLHDDGSITLMTKKGGVLADIPTESAGDWTKAMKAKLGIGPEPPSAGAAPPKPPVNVTAKGYSQKDIDLIVAKKKANFALAPETEVELLPDGSIQFTHPTKKTVLTPPSEADGWITSWKKTYKLGLAPAPVDGPKVTVGPPAKAPAAPKAAKVPTTAAPVPPGVPKAPAYGEPGWVSPNGLTQADVETVWNKKAKLLPDGSVKLTTVTQPPDKTAVMVQKAYASGGVKAPAGSAFFKPAAVDPLASLPTLDAHYGTPEGYDPTWTLPPGKTKRSYGAVVFDKDGRILLREPKGQYDGYAWTFPKGGPDAGESALKTAIRETSEETGVKFKAVSTIPGSHKGGSGTNHYFLGRVESATGVLDAETSRIRWVGWDEAEDLIKQTTNVTGQQRDLDVLHAAMKEYEKLTGKKPPTFPKVAKPPKPIEVVTAPVVPPPPFIAKNPIPGGPHVLPTFEGFPDAPDELTYVRDLGGSTGAKLMQDSQGRRYVMKKGASADHLREEVFADAAYHAAGVNVPEFRLYETKTGPVKLSKFIEGDSLKSVVATGGARAEAVLAKIREDLAADAIFGNWDVAGTGLDNILVDKKGIPWRIDNGGSLRFRAMGSRKEGKDWNDWPTELWTLRGFRHPSNETTEIFKSAKWKGILDRTDGLLAKRDSILRALPPEVRKTVAARLEVLEKMSRDSRMLMEDAFAEDYTDVFSMHRVGLGQHGVIAQLPKEMKGLHPPSDETGRAWGGLRSKQGAMGKFTDYLGSMGPNHAGIITEYMGEQAGSSQNSAPHVMKGWIMKQRPLAKGGYAGKITDDSTFVTKFNNRMKAMGPAYAEAYHEAMAAQHALTFELLGGVKAPSNDLVARTMRLGRSRSYKEPVGYVGPFTENPLESTFWADKEFHAGGAYAEWNVPHHRIFVTYWQSRPGRYNESGLCGDGENEFTAILAGLKGRRKR